MSSVLLAAGVVFVLFSLTSHRPLYRPGPLALATWIPGWLVSELPLHLIAAELSAAVGLSLAGGLATPLGVIGLALTFVSVLMLWHHVTTATITSLVVERAMRQGLGSDYHDHIGESQGEPYDPTVRWGELLRVVPRRPPGVTVDRDVVYHRDESGELALDIYKRADLRAGAPIFLYVHGGGWVIGSKNKQGLPTVHRLARRGWLVYTIDYRLSPRATFPEHLIDVKRAIAFARRTARDHGGDPRFIVAGGGSAGAHLASLAALTPNDARYQPGFAAEDTALQGCVCYYGIYDIARAASDTPHRGLDHLLERYVMKKRRQDDPEAFIAASPAALVTPAAPPCFLVHGTTDNLAPVSGARTMRDALTAAGVRDSVYVELAGAHHAFEIFPSLRSTAVISGVDRYCHFVYSRWRRTRGSETGARPSGPARG